MSEQGPFRGTRPDLSGTEPDERPAGAAARDIDAEGRPLARQEDEAPGTGAPGVDVGRPDAQLAGERADREQADREQADQEQADQERPAEGGSKDTEGLPEDKGGSEDRGDGGSA
jgi:hypothetical protein